MRVIRVFPRKTKATPDDALVAVNRSPVSSDEADQVHISVTFSWDLPAAMRLKWEWRHVAPVFVGGPATGQRGDDFQPGVYIKQGYTITSRGCPNRCWFCDVPRREGTIRELPIRPGHNVLDDNLLATSVAHQRAVFAMLRGQKKLGHRVEFTGGLEAARLLPWHVEELRVLRPKQMFFAYDTPDDLEPLRMAARMLREVGWTNNTLRCYVLCGWPRDSMPAAEKRMRDVLTAGLMPMAMLYRDRLGETDPDWRTFQRAWARPAIIRVRELS